MIFYRYVITPPTEVVVETADFKTQMGITSSSQDALITALIAAATSELDPAFGGWLGRSLRPTVWEWRGPTFPMYSQREYQDRGRIHPTNWTSLTPNLPFPPLKSLDSVKYTDGDGVLQTMTLNTDYRVFGVGEHGGGRIEPPYNGSWPSNIRSDHESVVIRFTAGYAKADDNKSNGLPGTIKQAVVLMAKQLLDLSARNLYLSNVTVDGVGSRQFVISQSAAKLLRETSESLLQPFRVYE